MTAVFRDHRGNGEKDCLGALNDVLDHCRASHRVAIPNTTLKEVQGLLKTTLRTLEVAMMTLLQAVEMLPLLTLTAR
jgi:hypothetical protein